MKRMIGALLLLASPAFGQGDAISPYWSDPRIRSCCSASDAVYADEWHVQADGSIIATVTGGTSYTEGWAPIGKTYTVPPDKVVDVPGNPTGRPLLFISRGAHTLFCFAMGPMT